jgi:ABC-type polysaccharide/polyol phosphate transport system ATPase subunit
VISLSDVTIEFPVYNRFLASEIRSMVKKSHRLILGGSPLHSRAVVAALRNITLTVRPGETLGLLGMNGAGKTTLLKTMAGIYRPTRGQIHIEGRVRGFFNLSAGLDNTLTGHENIQNLSFFYTKDPVEIRERMKEIVEFTGLGEFIYMPVSTYSSGMLARLLVSVAIHYDIEHLLFDEGLGAGDRMFLAKLSARIAKLVASAKTLVVASHSFPLLLQYCDRAALLRDGDLLYVGPIDRTIEEYKKVYPDE